MTGQEQAEHPTPETVSPPLRVTIGRLAAFVGVYLLAGWLARLSQMGPQSLTAIWPASGLVLAVLVLSPMRRWPIWLAAVWLCNMAQSLLSGAPWLVAAAYSTTDVAEGSLAARLLIASVGTPMTLGRLREVLALVGVAALASNAVTALLGAAVTTIWRTAPFWRTWFSWLMSNGVGMLLVAPVILAWHDGVSRLREGGRAHAVEALGLLVSFGVAAALVFSGKTGWGLREGSLFYLTFPWLMWAALRTGPFFVTLASIVVSTLAVAYTMRGAGPFAADTGTVQAKVLSLQACVSVTLSSYGGLDRRAPLLPKPFSSAVLGAKVREILEA